MPQNTFHRTPGILALAVISLLSARASMAQAGRHPPKRIETLPPPAATPEPTPPPKPPAKAQFSLKVVSDIPLTTYLLFTFPERMQTWTIDRLKKSSVLDVAMGAPANHHEAVQRARDETEAFIVWLQLEENLMGLPENAGRRPASGEVWINFSIFEPRTGKSKYSSRVVLSQTSTRGMANVQACYPTVGGDDYLLLQASLEVAARIMDSFHAPIPSVCP